MRSCACTRVYACRCVLVLVCTGTCTAPGNVYPGGAAFMQPHHPHHLSNQHPPPHHPTQLHALAPPADLSPNMPPGANNLGLNSISPLGQPPYRAPLVSRAVHDFCIELRLLSRKHWVWSVVYWFSSHVMKINHSSATRNYNIEAYPCIHVQENIYFTSLFCCFAFSYHKRNEI